MTMMDTHYTIICVGKCWERSATSIGSGRPPRSQTTSRLNKGRQPRWWLYSRCCLPHQSDSYFSYFILTHNVSLSLDRSLFRNKLVNSVLTTSFFQLPIEGGRLAVTKLSRRERRTRRNGTNWKTGREKEEEKGTHVRAHTSMPFQSSFDGNLRYWYTGSTEVRRVAILVAST